LNSPAKIAFGFFVLAVAALAQAPRFVGSVWSGNITPTTATVVARFEASAQRVRLQVSKAEDLSAPMFSAALNTSANTGNTAKLAIQGLQPDTDYYYGIEVAGVLRTDVESRGRFRTFPQGRASFRIAFASCGDFRAADQRAYEEIRRERPLLFINLGDLHYSDINSTVADSYRSAYDEVLKHPVQGALYRNVPVAYMWDDHDYCGDNTDTTAVGRDTARATYKERVPHYGIGPTGGTIGQAFTVGRVRFIMTDLRSASVSADQRESATKTRMGTVQKAWFKQELINARDNGFPLIVWVCPDPWIGPAKLGEDTWGGHATERTEIANFIRDNRISNLALLSGDMHGLAFDDGAHSDYATGGGAPVTVLHGAALTSQGSVKGGPYSGGAIPGSQQYGILEIYDLGGPSVACRFFGMKAGEGLKLTHIFSASSSGSRDYALANVSTLATLTGADSVVSGFVISGATNRRVLVRAVGPTLEAFGVRDALKRPMLSVFDSERLIASNSGWGEPAGQIEELTSAFDRVGAFRLVSETSADSALVLNLSSGAYTMQVKSGDGTPGAALLELYEVN
jgi:phosphodiesterase/alkaline phosphatase D-like protein